MIKLSIIIDDFGVDERNPKKPIKKPDFQFDEGPRMTSRIVCRPDEVKIGMRVKSVFRRIATDGETGIIHYGTKFMPVD